MPAASDTLITAINAANTRLNGKVETLQAVGGQIVGNTNAFSQQAVNSAWRKLQNKLADLRYSGLQADTVFVAVPAILTPDPMVQAYIDFAGYFNGSGTVNAPVLPANLIRPYELSERATGTPALFTYMDPALYALPRVVKANWNRQWLWRNNTLYLPGALAATDIAMLYAQLLPDFADGLTPWFASTIALPNCIDAFADYICREIYVGRGDMDAAAAMQLSAETNAAQMAGQDTVGLKGVQKASEYGKMADAYTPGRTTAG